MVWLISCFMTFNLNAATVKFEKSTVTIGKTKLSVEVAKTVEQQQQGLMHRTKLGQNEGMIFVFDNEDYRSFWMKNTLIDLSIGYFNKNRELVEVIDMKATTMLDLNPPSYPTQKKAQFAIEVNEGWFTKNKIKLGDKFNWD